MTNLAKSWITMYALLYVAAAVLGMGLAWFSPILNVVVMLIMAGLCIVALAIPNKWLRLALAFVWALAAMTNWMHIAIWVPPYTDFEYTVMAVLDMAQSVALIRLSEVFT